MSNQIAPAAKESLPEIRSEQASLVSQPLSLSYEVKKDADISSKIENERSVVSEKNVETLPSNLSTDGDSNGCSQLTSDASKDIGAPYPPSGGKVEGKSNEDKVGKRTDFRKWYVNNSNLETRLEEVRSAILLLNSRGVDDLIDNAAAYEDQFRFVLLND